jgi:two-component system nitrate/nitrite sensor histidine kinase NarX
MTPEPDAKADEGSRAARAGPRAQTPAVRLARKTQSLDVLYAVATSLSQTGSIEHLLGGFLDTFIELVDARAASVRLVTADGNTRLIASRGLEPEVVERDRLMPIGRCQCGWTSTGGGIHTQSGTGECAKLIGRPMLERDCKEFVVVPVQYQDRILGVYNLFLERPLAAMGEDVHDLLISVGRHLGLALEKARLESDARRLAIMEERNIIGNELHDSLAQSLIGMRLQLKMLSESLSRGDLGAARYEAKALQRAMTQANADLRDLLTNYRLKIDESGLVQTLATLVKRFRRETGIAVFFQNECQALALTPAQEIQVFYIVQEALTNIRKHSGARNVRILLNSEGDLYTVLIEDDGLGMVGSAEGMPGEHAGLAIMRERAARLPGQLVIESEPGEGTRIVLIFNAPPLAAPANAARG